MKGKENEKDIIMFLIGDIFCLRKNTIWYGRLDLEMHK